MLVINKHQVTETKTNTTTKQANKRTKKTTTFGKMFSHILLFRGSDSFRLDKEK